MLKINSLRLPFFIKEMVSIFLLDGSQIRVPVSQFQDVTSEGGRFYQFYTFSIGGNENESKRNEEMVKSLGNTQDSF
jgi:hypothetical protein